MTTTAMIGDDLAGVTPARVIHSEWVKLRSLRSTVWSLLASVVATVGIGILVSTVRANDIKHLGQGRFDAFDPTAISLRGLFLAQLAIGVLGVLVITGEYSTGMIRSTLAAVPRRLPVVSSKIVVFSLVVFALSYVSCLLAFEGGQAMLSSAHVQASLSSPGAARAVLGGALYLTVIGVLGTGLGFVLRNTAGAIATLFGLVLVLPLLAQALPASWYDHVFKYLPMPAGSAITVTLRDSGSLGPWAGIGVFALYALAAVLVGALTLKRRDA